MTEIVCDGRMSTTMRLLRWIGDALDRLDADDSDRPPEPTDADVAQSEPPGEDEAGGL